MGYLMGWDVFVSYARADALPYARRLVDRLGGKKGLSLYVDWRHAPPGDVLTKELRRALRRSRRLVLIVSEEAARSEFVRQEVDQFFAHTANPVIAIQVKGVSRPAWVGVRGVVWIEELHQMFTMADPSADIVDHIDGSIGADTQLRRTRRFAIGALAVVTAAVIVSVVMLSAARRANAERATAEAGRDAAMKVTAQQQNLARTAEERRRDAEERRRTADVERARAEAAMRAADLAATREREIAEATGQASEAEALLRQERRHQQRAMLLAAASVRRFSDLGVRSLAADLALRNALDGSGRITRRIELATKGGAYAITSNGRYGAAFDGERVELWNLETGARRFLPLGGDRGATPVDLVFSHDGSHLVAAAWSRPTLRSWSRVWRVSDGKPLAATLPHYEQFAAIALSSDGVLFATWESGGTVRVWASATNRPAHQPIEYERAFLRRRNSLRFSNSGRYLAAYASVGKVWDLCDPVGGEGARLGGWAVAFSEDDRLLVDFSRGMTAYELPKMKPIWSIEGTTEGHDVVVDGDLVIAAREDEIEVRESATGDLVRTLPMEGVRTVVVNDVLLGALADDGTARLFAMSRQRILDVEKGMSRVSGSVVGEEIAHVAHPTGGVAMAVAYPRRAVSMSRLDALLWDGTSALEDEGYLVDVSQAAFAPDAERLATLDESVGTFTLSAPDVVDGRYVSKPGAGSPSPFGLAYGRGGVAVVGTFEGEVLLWNGRRDSDLVPLRPAFESPVRDVALSPSSRVVAATTGGEVVLWDARTRKLLARLDHPRDVKSIAFASEDELVTTCEDDRMRWWRWQPSPRVRISVHTPQAFELRLLADGRIAAAEESEVVVRDVDGAVVERIRHGDTITAILAGRNGWLATTGYDGMLRVWQRTAGQPTVEITRMRLRRNGAFPLVIAIPPDGQYVLAGDSFRVRMLTLDPQRLLKAACERLHPVASGDSLYRRACA